ncbi:hypothetical protein LTR74_014983, partial [Friedmanniomyces endolithicus]
MASPPLPQVHSNQNSPWLSAPWALCDDSVSGQFIVYCVWKSAPPELKAEFQRAIRDSDAGNSNESISCDEGDLRGQSKAKDELVIDDANSCRETNNPLGRRAGKSNESGSCEPGDLDGPFKAKDGL